MLLENKYYAIISREEDAKLSPKKLVVDILNLFVIFMAVAFTVLYSKCYHSFNIDISSRSTLTLIFVFGILIFGILFVLKRFPRFYPFPVKVNTKNMMFQAWLAQLFLTIISIIVLAIFTVMLYKEYTNILITDIQVIEIPDYIPIGLIASCLITIVIYIIIAIRHK